jgi:hypothetical protein
METPLIEFQKVSKHFNNHVVLDQVDLTIYEGQVTTIIALFKLQQGGPNSENICPGSSGERVEHDPSGSPHFSGRLFSIRYSCGFSRE